mmetsp:Transcript_16383/g.55302  ORF Transcript_16383/g.55302 Transcript_16383/m.55302 type:complete len:217 (-) Transcript_16383:152-802(-)
MAKACSRPKARSGGSGVTYDPQTEKRFVVPAMVSMMSSPAWHLRPPSIAISPYARREPPRIKCRGCQRFPRPAKPRRDLPDETPESFHSFPAWSTPWAVRRAWSAASAPARMPEGGMATTESGAWPCGFVAATQIAGGPPPMGILEHSRRNARRCCSPGSSRSGGRDGNAAPASAAFGLSKSAMEAKSMSGCAAACAAENCANGLSCCGAMRPPGN